MVDNLKKLSPFLTKFKDVQDREEKKLPYHINLIDELRANENAHSRILGRLLQQKNALNGKYELLESFLQFISEKNQDKKEFGTIKIDTPRITQEEQRIDLWIRDSNYAIIIENKINNAVDQPKQLERYIKATIETEEKFKQENIFVLYLPPTYEKEPNKETWGEYFEHDIHKNRFLNLSFKDDVLPWLKQSALPNIRLKDRYLSSTIEQYIDHLEGRFSLRIINNKMNMELQKIIKKELELSGDNTGEDLEKVLNKKNEMQNVLTQLIKLEEEIKIAHFNKWRLDLEDDFRGYSIVENVDVPGKFRNVCVQFSKPEPGFSLMIEYYDSRDLYYGIKKHQEKVESAFFKDIVLNLELKENDSWYGWAYTTFPEAYGKLKTLIERVEKL